MILDPSQTGRQRPAGGASSPVYYPRAGYTDLGPAGVVGVDFDPIRSTKMGVPNANGPQAIVPGSALHPQPNA